MLVAVIKVKLSMGHLLRFCLITDPIGLLVEENLQSVQNYASSSRRC